MLILRPGHRLPKRMGTQRIDGRISRHGSTSCLGPSRTPAMDGGGYSTRCPRELENHGGTASLDRRVSCQSRQPQHGPSNADITDLVHSRHQTHSRSRVRIETDLSRWRIGPRFVPVSFVYHLRHPEVLLSISTNSARTCSIATDLSKSICTSVIRI